MLFGQKYKWVSFPFASFPRSVSSRQGRKERGCTLPPVVLGTGGHKRRKQALARTEVGDDDSAPPLSNVFLCAAAGTPASSRIHWPTHMEVSAPRERAQAPL